MPWEARTEIAKYFLFLLGQCWVGVHTSVSAARLVAFLVAAVLKQVILKSVLKAIGAKHVSIIAGKSCDSSATLRR